MEPLQVNTDQKYCYYCGHEEFPFESNFFDVNTGKRYIHTRCMNVDCKTGCFNNGGHKYKRTFFGLIKGSCVRCGYDFYNGD
jgi:hypothetical protein